MQQPSKHAEFRNAAAMAVENTSLRSVATEIGMSPTGLKKFLNGTNPYGPTLHKLRRWHAERLATARPPTLDPELFAIALDLLFSECHPDAAAVGKERAYECLELRHGVAIPRITPPLRTVQVAECEGARLALPASAQAAPVRWTVARPPALTAV